MGMREVARYRDFAEPLAKTLGQNIDIVLLSLIDPGFALDTRAQFGAEDTLHGT